MAKITTHSFIFLFVFLLLGCQKSNPSSSSSGSKVTTVVKSSQLTSTSIMTNSRATVALTDITGLADSVVMPLYDQTQCGYVIFSANEQSGKIGIAGRTYESLDLGTPPTWTHAKDDLNCDGGNARVVQLLTAYLDIHMTVDGTAKIIRVATGNYSPYTKGDVLIKSNDVWNWVNADTTSLVAETGTRPTNPVKIAAVASAPMYTSGDEVNGVLSFFNIGIVDSSGTATTVQLSKSVTKVTVDFDLSSPGITVGNTTSDAQIASTFAMAAFTNISDNPFKAKVTVEGVTAVSRISGDPAKWMLPDLPTFLGPS